MYKCDKNIVTRMNEKKNGKQQYSDSVLTKSVSVGRSVAAANSSKYSQSASVSLNRIRNQGK